MKKFKYNLSLFVNEHIKFLFNIEGHYRCVEGCVEQVKQFKDYIDFYIDGRKLRISERLFLKMSIDVLERDGSVILSQQDNPNFVSGIVGFTMYDTYGFPIELTKEILEEQELKLDIRGFESLKFLQKVHSTPKEKVDCFQ